MSEPSHALVLIDDEAHLRVRVVVADSVVEDALARHAPSPVAAHALARALIVAALYPTSFKDLSRVSVQLSGTGPLGSAFGELRAPGHLRAMVREPHVVVPDFVDNARGRGLALGRAGMLTVLRQDTRGHVTTGQCMLTTGELDEDVEAYFDESEQIPTRLRARLDRAPVLRARGVLVQRLPEGDAALLPSRDVLDDALATAGDALAIAHAALPSRPLRVLERVPLELRCTCSRDRVRASIALLDDDLLQAAIEEDHGASVKCDFCATDYRFDEDELRELARLRAEHGRH